MSTKKNENVANDLTTIDEAIADIFGVEVKEAKEVKEVKEAKKGKTEKAKAKEAKAKEAKTEKAKADIQPIVAKLPDTFTPALLDKLFNLNDGGKTVRRHLRKNFAEPLGHEHKDKWSFSKTQTDIIQYFADRYAYDLKVLEPVKTA